jgi:GT2 family glycosyltransferase
MSDLAVLLVHYNHIQTTYECVNSVLASELNDLFIVVVDVSCNSKDMTFFQNLCAKEHITFSSTNYKENKFSNKSINWFAAGKNLGYAGGMNLAAEIAIKNNPKYLLLLNNDTLLSKDFLPNFLEEIKSKEYQSDFGLASCLIRSWPEKKIWYAGGSFNSVRCMGEHRLSMPQNMEIQETGFISGCCMLCRPEFYQDLDGMDESFFLYYEDVDFCYRAVQKGYKLFFAPQVELFHKVGSSTGGDETEISAYYSSRNRIRLMRKHFNGFILYRFYLFFIFNRLIKALKWSLSGRRALVVALWRGIKAGLCEGKKIG